jgi:hypothetical protein
MLPQVMNPAPGKNSPTAAALIFGDSTNFGLRNMATAITANPNHCRNVRV